MMAASIFTASAGTLDQSASAALVRALSDVALVIDANGVICDVRLHGPGPRADAWSAWLGCRWQDTVAEDSRDKVAKALSTRDEELRELQINQVLADGAHLLVAYRLVALDDDRWLALGRNLATQTRLQQRLVEAQQAMERDYARLRRFETRYRSLLQSTRDAVLIVNTGDGQVIEANPAACTMFDVPQRRLVGGDVFRWFDEVPRRALADALASVRVGGALVPVLLRCGSQRLRARLFPCIEGEASLALLRLQAEDAGDESGAGNGRTASAAAWFEHAPDALVLTDTMGQVIHANAEFLALAQNVGAELATGKALARWLGQGGVDYQVILTSVREHGAITLYRTQMRGEFGSVTDVEVSAVALDTDGQSFIGFAIRDVGRRIAVDEGVASLTPRSIDQLTQLVGRVPLRELVGESTELIERLCILAALRLTGNNRAAAAELLGLSRQSLYVKLRRYELSDEVDPPG